MRQMMHISGQREMEREEKDSVSSHLTLECILNDHLSHCTALLANKQVHHLGAQRLYFLHKE